MRHFAVVVVVAWPLVAQHEKEGEKPKHRFIGDAKAIEEGRKLFSDGCGVCHGPEGQGGRGPNLRDRVFWHPLDDDTIYKAIKNGIKSGMPPANLSEDDTWRVVAFTRALTSPAFENPVTGDPKTGEAIFWGKGGCGNCHGIRGRGGKLGPDLGNTAAVRSFAHLREAILDPDADGAAGYRAATVVLRSGKTFKGVARNRTNYSIQLQDAEGNLQLVSMSDVTAVTLGSGSPMPKDFAKRLSESEIDGIVAFLARQSIRPAEISKK